MREKGSANFTQHNQRYEASFSMNPADSKRSYEREDAMDAKELPVRPHAAAFSAAAGVQRDFNSEREGMETAAVRARSGRDFVCCKAWTSISMAWPVLGGT